MSLSAEERQKGIQPLTKDNYLVRSEMIKDYILCLDCDDAEGIWAAAWWDREAVMKVAQAAADEANEGDAPAPAVDPLDYYDNLPGETADEKKFRTSHARTFAYIRRSLSPAIFEKTLGHKTNVPRLLRMLKNCWRQHDARSRPHAH